MSFRSGNSKLSVSDLKVYRSRYTGDVSILVGASTVNDIRFQNTNPLNCAAKIKSIVCDSALNLSAVFNLDLNIDWSVPANISYINDGVGVDIDTTDIPNTLAANWAATTDPHSGIVKYWYSIGTIPGGTNVVGWTDNGLNTSFTVTGLTLINHQIYYVNVRAENGAGLQSNIITSDGQVYIQQTSVNEFDAFYGWNIFPNPFSNYLNISYTLKSTANVGITINDMVGKNLYTYCAIQTGRVNLKISNEDMKLKPGIYQMVLKINNDSRSLILIKTIDQ